MRALPIKTHLILLTLAIGSATIAVIAAVIMPTTSGIMKISADIAADRRQAENDAIHKTNPERSLRELEAVIKQVEKFAKSTVPPGEDLRLITTFEDLADRHHLTQTLKLDSSAKQYLFSISNTGAFADQMNFFRSVEQLPYYVIIDKIDWTKPSGSADNRSVTTRFTAKIYANAT